MQQIYTNRIDPFNQVKTTLSLEDLTSIKGDATVFVETGTNVGAGVQNAIDAGFDKIISIEVVESLHRICKERFKNNKNVELILGSSREKLFPSIQTIEGKMIFWLDGHEYFDIPLTEELIQIKSLSRNDHIILIDDVRMFDTPEWGGFSKEKTINLIMEINPNYEITYLDSIMGKNDILVAKV